MVMVSMRINSGSASPVKIDASVIDNTNEIGNAIAVNSCRSLLLEERPTKSIPDVVKVKKRIDTGLWSGVPSGKTPIRIRKMEPRRMRKLPYLLRSVVVVFSSP